MPATIKHIMANVGRMDDPELIKLWNAQAVDSRAPVQAWAAFIEAADAVGIADRIPGTIGRTYAAKYAAQADLATRRQTRKATTKAKAAGK
jgi:hypothetical protein